MNEEKEDLRRQVERLQGQITNLTNQVKFCVCTVLYIRINSFMRMFVTTQH